MERFTEFINVIPGVNRVTRLIQRLTNKEIEGERVKWENLKAKQGDIIEFKRGGYKHYGIYSGEGYIIHLDVPFGKIKAEISRKKLSEVAKNDMCCVNNLTEAAQKRGLEKRSDDDILKAAFDKLHMVMEYNLLFKNCEIFATDCYYGAGFSDQVAIAKEFLL